MDKNDDGQISRDEWLGPPRNFPRIDTNKDQSLSHSELVEWFDQRKSTSPEREGQKLKNGIRWIDTHVHPIGGRGEQRDYSSAVDSAVRAMDPAGISRIVLMPPPQVNGSPPPFTYEDFAYHTRKYPKQVSFLGGGGSLNAMLHDNPDGESVSGSLSHRFRKKAEEILHAGAIGFGEISIHHLSLMHSHPYESVPADHPLLLLLADIAAEKGVVIDVHFDPVTEPMKAPDWMSVPPNPPTFQRNIDAFERFLAHNRGAKIVWAHAGSDMLGHWTVQLSRELLERHPNLYMSMRMGKGRVPRNHPLIPGGIKPEWLKLITDYPDRFVLGGDQFFAASFVRGPGASFAQKSEMIRNRSNLLLERLPEDLARRVGYENAMAIYNLGGKH